ncbi:V-type ATP synthase subunit I [Halorubellus sp. JP-L1]|uniref:V-type ATP synthase subunit I n=1 Tax=Halorubellus sp. JP-L1 TaxID=2715753 RepID=UPI00140AD2FF|nr:V-type ATP synthase subunit I [Halorubellus sp. JP-L1]NHN41867.1 V-type ATP synthase subunit I [Halorubellus sp. JP-L1]
MLRPERMSKVSVTGSKAVMGDVIETVHDLNLVHLSDYDGSWEGFDNGDPVAGAESASEKLVTVRSLENILEVDDADAGPSRIVTDDALDEELEEVRQEANRLDDRRDELEDELRGVEERIDSIEPFARLGTPLHLLSGYETLEVRVGEGNADGIRQALRDAAVVREFEVEEADGVVAAYVYPESNAREGFLDDLLVGVDFTTIEVPEDAEGDPSAYVEELEHRKQRLESKLNTAEDEIDELRLEVASFLLAAEERLSIDVQKSEAPLQFATTENAFVAEGWIPTERVDSLQAALGEVVGDRVDVEELERADYDRHGHPDHTEAVTDGGTVSMAEEPPTVQDNNGFVSPFESLTKMVGRPQYTEIDPTVIIMLTFPFMFGFMIGDLGYGILYTALGYGIYKKFDSEIVQSIGAIALFAGVFTMLFGVLYGEVFGMHTLGEILFDGHPPMHKGLQPTYGAYARSWLVLSLVAGILHMTVGFWFGFVNDRSHGLVDAFTHNLAWWFLMIGVWSWMFSAQALGIKDPILFEPLRETYIAGFEGLPEVVGTLGLVVALVGFVGVLYGEYEKYGAPGLAVGVLESPNAFVNVLSYIRIAAVLLAKAGMALVVNLLFWGAYEHDGAIHFLTDKGPSAVPAEELMFGGLVHGGVPFVLLGVVIFVVGHLLVLVLGVTSAGLQGVRLEFVEFFDKFYEGGGRVFEPFGYDREYTTED